MFIISKKIIFFFFKKKRIHIQKGKIHILFGVNILVGKYKRYKG